MIVLLAKVSLLRMKPLLHVIGQSDHQHNAHCAFSFVDQVIFFDVKHLATSLGKFYNFFLLSKGLSCSTNMKWIFLIAPKSRGFNNSYLDPLCIIVFSLVLIVIFPMGLLEWWQISLWHDCIVVEAVVFDSCTAFTCDRSVSSPTEYATCICIVGEGYFTGFVYLPTFLSVDHGLYFV